MEAFRVSWARDLPAGPWFRQRRRLAEVDAKRRLSATFEPALTADFRGFRTPAGVSECNLPEFVPTGAPHRSPQSDELSSLFAAFATGALHRPA